MVCSVGLFLVFSIMSCAYMAGSDVKKEAHKPRFNVGYQVLDFKHQKDGQEQFPVQMTRASIYTAWMK